MLTKLLSIIKLIWNNIKSVFSAVTKSYRKINTLSPQVPEAEPIPSACANAALTNISEPVITTPEKNIPEFNRNLVISDDDFLHTPPDFDIQKFLEKQNSFLAKYKVNGLYGESQPRLVSEIIKEASKYVSARVIITTLQKEQSLITMRNVPVSQKTLDWAMGFGYEDGQDIKIHFKGLENQILKAAERLKYLFDNEAEKFIDKDISRQFLNRWAVVRDGIVNPVNKATVCLYAYTPFIGERNYLVGGKYMMKAPFGNRYFWDIWQLWFS